MRRWTLLSAVGVVVCIALAGWREGLHARARAAWEADAAAHAHKRDVLEADLAETRAALEATDDRLAAMEIERQSLRDRSTNLSAQRDHLRAEVDRRAAQARAAEQALEQAREALQVARQDLIDQAAVPRELEGKLAMANSRIGELEAALDERATDEARYPPLLEVAGLSEDRQVFALRGDLPRNATLPFPVYLCRQDRIVLEGWLHRVEDGTAIGHVKRWRNAASTLVNGQKVFILPAIAHEAD